MTRLLRFDERASTLLLASTFALGAFLGCGRVSDDPLAGKAGTAGKAGGGTGGAGTAGEGNAPLGGQAGVGEGGGGGNELTRCSTNALFGAPETVPGLPDGAIRVRLNQDETVAYYARYHEVYLYQIESAMRANRHDAFSTFAFVGTNDDGWDLSPSVTGDGLVLYFESQRSGLGWRIHQSVWEASRRNFVGVDQVPGLRDETLPGSDGGPYTLPSGEALYFHSSRFESGQYIARASRAGTAFTGVEQVAIEFATDPPQALTFPVVSPDELTLYFTAHDLDERTDIWRATRTTTTEPFGKAAPVIELSTEEFNEVPSFVSEDGCRLYFDRDTSHPPGWNPGDHHGLVAHREPDSE